MKKLSIFLIAFGLMYSVYAQTQAIPVQRSFNFVLGPNLARALKYGLYNDDIQGGLGVSMGADYFQTLTSRWEAKISARYHYLAFSETQYTTVFDTVGGFVFPVGSDAADIPFKQHAFGFSAGLRQWGRPKKARWFWTGDAGITVFTKKLNKQALSFALGMGWQWIPGDKKWAFTVSPVARGMFLGALEPFQNQWAFAVEFGLRRLHGAKTKG